MKIVCALLSIILVSEPAVAMQQPTQRQRVVFYLVPQQQQPPSMQIAIDITNPQIQQDLINRFGTGNNIQINDLNQMHAAFNSGAQPQAQGVTAVLNPTRPIPTDYKGLCFWTSFMVCYVLILINGLLGIVMVVVSGSNNQNRNSTMPGNFTG